MENMRFEPNSHKSKEVSTETPETKRVEKVVHGAVKTKKKSEMRKFTDIFISEDASNVKDYILMDVLVPAVKKAISDIITNGIDMILYGGHAPGKRTTSAGNVSYRSYYDRRREDDRRYESSRSRTQAYSHDDIVLETRGEAEEVLERMSELIELYGQVSVADMYDLVGITGQYTDNSYGWTNIRNAETVRVRDGYLLKLPKVLPIKN